MTDTPTQVALRELRTQFTAPLALGVLAAVTVVVAVSGPFNTSQMMTLPERAAYWAFVTPATYAAGLFGSAFMRQALAARKIGLIAKVGLRALASAVAVSAILFSFNAVFGFRLPVGWEIPASLGSVLVICIAIEVIEALANHHRPKPSTASLPPILQRLPLDKRAALISISAVDHYIEVTTLKGSQLILMRLADAMAEAAPTAGLQIHRSHWAAIDQIIRAVRVGDGGMVTLTGGRELPISRSRIGDAVAAGLFAKSG